MGLIAEIRERLADLGVDREMLLHSLYTWISEHKSQGIFFKCYLKEHGSTRSWTFVFCFSSSYHPSFPLFPSSFPNVWKTRWVGYFSDLVPWQELISCESFWTGFFYSSVIDLVSWWNSWHKANVLWLFRTQVCILFSRAVYLLFLNTDPVTFPPPKFRLRGQVCKPNGAHLSVPEFKHRHGQESQATLSPRFQATVILIRSIQLCLIISSTRSRKET